MKLSKSKWRIFFLLLPSLLFVLIFVGYGLFMAGVESMESAPSPFYNYERLFSSNDFIESIKISLIIAFVSTILSLLIGVILTRWMFRLFVHDSWKFIAWIPMLIPHFVAAYLVFLLFAPSGWFSSVFYNLGWISGLNELPYLVNDPLYIGVILTYVWKEVPFVILLLLPAYQELDFRFEDVVKTLGGSSWKVWTTVELPWLWPILLEVGLIVMSFIMGAFEVPALLGVTFPKMLPILAFDWFYENNWVNRPLAQALMVSLSIVTVVVSYILLRLNQKSSVHWSNKGER